MPIRHPQELPFLVLWCSMLSGCANPANVCFLCLVSFLFCFVFQAVVCCVTFFGELQTKTFPPQTGHPHHTRKIIPSTDSLVTVNLLGFPTEVGVGGYQNVENTGDSREAASDKLMASWVMTDRIIGDASESWVSLDLSAQPVGSVPSLSLSSGQQLLQGGVLGIL